MPRVRLVCWNPDLSRERVPVLERAGFTVDGSPLDSAGVLGYFRATAPQAAVIDLDRLPSHGFEVAAALRRSKWTRHIAIVFAGGAADKVERIRRDLPDACFTKWTGVARALKQALKNAPAAPVQPIGHMERYAGSSLVKKLGLKAPMQAALLGAPEGFEETLGELPDGVDLEAKMTKQTRLAIWFVRSRRELESGMEYIASRLPEGASVWVVHPKQSGRYRVDFNQNDVRAGGLAAGLVDYKVCAVDADWSGLKFARKRQRAQ